MTPLFMPGIRLNHNFIGASSPRANKALKPSHIFHLTPVEDGEVFSKQRPSYEWVLAFFRFFALSKINYYDRSHGYFDHQSRKK